MSEETDGTDGTEENEVEHRKEDEGDGKEKEGDGMGGNEVENRKVDEGDGKERGDGMGENEVENRKVYKGKRRVDKGKGKAKEEDGPFRLIVPDDYDYNSDNPNTISISDDEWMTTTMTLVARDGKCFKTRCFKTI